MSMKFNPSGFLDVATDPSDLPEQGEGRNAASGAMTRCTNMHLDKRGVAKTRRGSSKVNASAISGGVNTIVEQGGYRFTMTDTGKISRNTASIATGLGSDPWESVLYNAFNVTTQSVFTTNGTDRKRITGTDVNEWGIEAPTEPATIADKIDWSYTYDWELDDGHASGNTYQFAQVDEDNGYSYLYDWEKQQLDGTAAGSDSATSRPTHFFDARNSNAGEYGVRYTYVRKSGVVLESESDPSPAVTAPIRDGLFVRWAASADPQVTHVRIYRTLAGGTAYLFAEEIAIGTTSRGLDPNDFALGTVVSINHDRIPAGATALAGPTFNGALFAAVGNRLHHSLGKQPEYWPSTYWVEVGSPQFPILALVLHNGQLHAFTRHKIWLIQGTGKDSYFPIPFDGALTGTVGPRACKAVQGKGIYHIAADGVYLFDGSTDIRISDSQFRPIFDGTTAGSIPGLARAKVSASITFQHAGKIWFGYPGSGEAYAGQWLVQDLETGKTVHYDYGVDFRAVTIDHTNRRILGVDTSGYVWEMDDPDSTDDDGTAVAWQVQGKDWSDQVRTYFPRYARYDVALASGAAATGAVLVDEVVLQTHAITSRKTRKRNITPGNGRRLAQRISGTGGATVYQTEVE